MVVLGVRAVAEADLAAFAALAARVGRSMVCLRRGDSVVSATEKLMGLVLTAIAVEMILAGLKRYFLG